MGRAIMAGNLKNALRVVVVLALASAGWSLDVRSYGFSGAGNRIGAIHARGDSLYVFSRSGVRVMDREGAVNRSPTTGSWLLSQAISVASDSRGPIWALTRDLASGTTRLFRWEITKAAELVEIEAPSRNFRPDIVLVDSLGIPWLIGSGYIGRLWKGAWIWGIGPSQVYSAAFVGDRLCLGVPTGMVHYRMAVPPRVVLIPVMGPDDEILRDDTAYSLFSEDSSLVATATLGGATGGVYSVTGNSSGFAWLGYTGGLAKWSPQGGVAWKAGWESGQIGYAILEIGDTVWSTQSGGLHFRSTKGGEWSSLLVQDARLIAAFGGTVWAAGTSGIHRRSNDGWREVDPQPVRSVSAARRPIDATSTGLFFQGFDLNGSEPAAWAATTDECATSQDGRIRWRSAGVRFSWSTDAIRWNDAPALERLAGNWTPGADTTVLLWTGERFWIMDPRKVSEHPSPRLGVSISGMSVMGRKLYMTTVDGAFWDASDAVRPTLLREGVMGFSSGSRGLLFWTSDSIHLVGGAAFPLPVARMAINAAAMLDSSTFLLGTTNGLWVGGTSPWRLLDQSAGAAEDVVYDVACGEDGVCWTLGFDHATRWAGLASSKSATKRDASRVQVKRGKVHDILGRNGCSKGWICR